MPKRITHGIELLADPARRRIVALIANGTRRPAAIADADRAEPTSDEPPPAACSCVPACFGGRSPNSIGAAGFT